MYIKQYYDSGTAFNATPQILPFRSRGLNTSVQYLIVAVLCRFRRICERSFNEAIVQSPAVGRHQHSILDHKGAITSKLKHAIKLKTSPVRLAQLLHNCCSPHWHFVTAQCGLGIACRPSVRPSVRL